MAKYFIGYKAVALIQMFMCVSRRQKGCHRRRQEIADRETNRLVKLEKEQDELKARVTLLEKMMFEKDLYIQQLKRTINDAGLKLPARPIPNYGQ